MVSHAVCIRDRRTNHVNHFFMVYYLTELVYAKTREQA